MSRLDETNEGRVEQRETEPRRAVPDRRAIGVLLGAAVGFLFATLVASTSLIGALPNPTTTEGLWPIVVQVVGAVLGGIIGYVLAARR